MINIITEDEKVFPWSYLNGIYFRGYMWYENKLYKGERAIELVLKNDKKIDFIANKCDGMFSIIFFLDNCLYAINDKMRSFPIFYTRRGDSFIVSDKIEKLILKDTVLDKQRVEEFRLNTLWIREEGTLYKDIYSIPANFYLRVNEVDTTYDLIEFYAFESKCYLRENEVRINFKNVYDEVGRRLVEELNGRTAVIPLSGGYDSRMIVDLLKKMNYHNVICYTYGSSKDIECKISRQIAEDRGYKWFFVKYTSEKHKKLYKAGEYEAYFRFAGNGISLPHIQDFLAVMELKEMGVLPDNSVFVPGHSGDLLAGSHITELFLKKEITKEEFVKWFNYKFYNAEFKTTYRCDYAEKVWELACKKDGGTSKKSLDSTLLLSLAETVNIRERQSKFIVNSCKAYEYFGYEWLIPLWDRQLIEFWGKIPTKDRYKRKLYIELVDQKGFCSTADETIYSKVADRIRKVKVIANILRMLRRVYDYFGSSHKLYSMYGLKNNLETNIKSRGVYTYNTLSCEYYISMLLRKKM